MKLLKLAASVFFWKVGVIVSALLISGVWLVSGSTGNVAALNLDVNVLCKLQMPMMECFLCAWPCAGLPGVWPRAVDHIPQLSVG